jgi:ABC-2 type transport system permease protein
MTVPVPSSKPVWPAVWRLLRLRMQLGINTFRHYKLRAKIFTIIGILSLLGLAGFVFFVSWLFLGFLRSPELGRYVEFDTGSLLQAVPELLLTGLFFGVMFTSFGVLLQALYLAGDMDFLLASPVPMRAVFITKLTQAVLPNFGMFALFGLPVLYGLGISSGYHILYYPVVLLVMATLTLAAAGLSALLVMAVVRVLRPRRAAEILGFIGAIAGVLCSQIANLSQTFGGSRGLSPSLAGGAVSLAMRLRTPWIPLNWAGQGLVDIGEGRWLPGAALVAVTLCLTALVFWFALATSERLYYSGWAGMQVVARKVKPGQATRGGGASGKADLSWIERQLPGPIRAIIAKDFILLGRDLRNLSQLISPLIVGIVLTLSLVRGGGEPPPGRGEAPAWFMESFRAALAYGSVAVALFVGWIMLGRLAGMSFSHEGKNFWMLKASPVSPRQMLAAKFMGAYLPTLGLGTLLLVGLGLLQRTSVGQLLFDALVIALCLAGLSGILMGFGAAGANFKWDDPRKMNAGGLGCLGQVVTAVFLPIGLGLFMAPLILATLFQLPQYYGYLGGVILGVGGNLIFAILPLRLVESRVQRLDEA